MDALGVRECTARPRKRQEEGYHDEYAEAWKEEPLIPRGVRRPAGDRYCRATRTWQRDGKSRVGPEKRRRRRSTPKEGGGRDRECETERKSKRSTLREFIRRGRGRKVKGEYDG